MYENISNIFKFFKIKKARIFNSILYDDKILYRKYLSLFLLANSYNSLDTYGYCCHTKKKREQLLEFVCQFKVLRNIVGKQSVVNKTLTRSHGKLNNFIFLRVNLTQ